MDEAMKSAEATTYPEGLEWHWYGGDDGERYYIGPYASREQVIADINRDGLERAYIVEAAKQPVKLSAYFSVDSLTDALLDDVIADPEGDHDIEINATPAQTEELVMAVRIAIDHWQARHGIVIMPWAFTFSRNEEMIERTAEPSEGI